MTGGGRRRERGVVIVVVAMSVAAIFVVTALVIDLSFRRSDRRSDQRAVDAAAAAGALTVATDGGVVGCSAALAYLEANLPAVSSFTGIDCTAFPATCDDLTASVAETGTSGDFTATIVHPVPDAHALMAASAIGSPVPPVTSADGDQCERLGVQLTLAREPIFGRIAGAGTETTTVHAVAIGVATPTGFSRPLNVLVLERHECQAVHAAGGGEIIVDAVTDPDDPTNQEPGTLAADSDGTETCGGGAGVIDVDGSGALVRADGPAGCAEFTPDNGDGCGAIELVAAGVPGGGDYCAGSDELPACQSSGVVRPNPIRTTEVRTRSPIDHRYNCKASYITEPWFAEQPIVGCSDGRRDYVDELKDHVDDVAADPAGAGWNVWGDTPATEPCTLENNHNFPASVGSVGNWYVACNTFIVKRSFSFPGGNIIFNGDVVVEGGAGHLRINECASGCGSSLSFTAGADFDEDQFADDAAWVAFRAGDGIRKAGAANLTIDHALMLFVDTECHAVDVSGNLTDRCLQLEGGQAAAGALSWSAPSEGPFDDLALWSEGTRQHDFAGQATLGLEGVFFVPSATAFYRGNGAQQQVDAQFIAEKLRVEGGGALVVRPVYDRAVLFPDESGADLIR